MNKPLITVIVPLYNVEQYLRRCIESIICQTYDKLEFVLVGKWRYVLVYRRTV